MGTNVLIAFHSRSGIAERLAGAVAEGARSVGAEVRPRRAREVVALEVMAHVPGWREQDEAVNGRHQAPAEADAERADAVAFGTPTRFAAVCSEFKAFIHGLGRLWFQGKPNGKAGSVFGSSSSRHGGNESTLLSLYNPLAHLGLVVVPLGYADPAMFLAGTSYGATAVSGREGARPTDVDLEVARFQGRRVAHVAEALQAADITATKQGQADPVGAA